MRNVPATRYGITLSTFQDQSPGALHYYAHAWREDHSEDGPTTRREQAVHAMSAEQADRLNLADGVLRKHEGNPYREGDLTWRFDDEDTAVAAALAQVLRWTGGARVALGVGEPYYAEPDAWIDWDDYERRGLVPADGAPPPPAPVDPRLEVHANLKPPTRR